MPQLSQFIAGKTIGELLNSKHDLGNELQNLLNQDIKLPAERLFDIGVRGDNVVKGAEDLYQAVRIIAAELRKEKNKNEDLSKAVQNI